MPRCQNGLWIETPIDGLRELAVLRRTVLAVLQSIAAIRRAVRTVVKPMATIRRALPTTWRVVAVLGSMSLVGLQAIAPLRQWRTGRAARNGDLMIVELQARRIIERSRLSMGGTLEIIARNDLEPAERQ